MMAAENGLSQTIKILLEHDADINKQSEVNSLEYFFDTLLPLIITSPF